MDTDREWQRSGMQYMIALPKNPCFAIPAEDLSDVFIHDRVPQYLELGSVPTLAYNDGFYVVVLASDSPLPPYTGDNSRSNWEYPLWNVDVMTNVQYTQSANPWDELVIEGIVRVVSPHATDGKKLLKLETAPLPSGNDPNPPQSWGSIGAAKYLRGIPMEKDANIIPVQLTECHMPKAKPSMKQDPDKSVTVDPSQYVGQVVRLVALASGILVDGRNGYTGSSMTTTSSTSKKFGPVVVELPHLAPPHTLDMRKLLWYGLRSHGMVEVADSVINGDTCFMCGFKSNHSISRKWIPSLRKRDDDDNVLLIETYDEQVEAQFGGSSGTGLQARSIKENIEESVSYHPQPTLELANELLARVTHPLPLTHNQLNKVIKRTFKNGIAKARKVIAQREVYIDNQSSTPFGQWKDNFKKQKYAFTDSKLYMGDQNYSRSDVMNALNFNLADVTRAAPEDSLHADTGYNICILYETPKDDNTRICPLAACLFEDIERTTSGARQVQIVYVFCKDTHAKQGAEELLILHLRNELQQAEPGANVVYTLLNADVMYKNADPCKWYYHEATVRKFIKLLSIGMIPVIGWFNNGTTTFSFVQSKDGLTEPTAPNFTEQQKKFLVGFNEVKAAMVDKLMTKPLSCIANNAATSIESTIQTYIDKVETEGYQRGVLEQTDTSTNTILGAYTVISTAKDSDSNISWISYENPSKPLLTAELDDSSNIMMFSQLDKTHIFTDDDILDQLRHNFDGPTYLSGVESRRAYNFSRIMFQAPGNNPQMTIYRQPEAVRFNPYTTRMDSQIHRQGPISQTDIIVKIAELNKQVDQLMLQWNELNEQDARMHKQQLVNQINELEMLLS